MDGFINSSIEKQTIYEIYRACRLCGAGAGYKMPIMQNVVHLDVAEIELRQKIRDCVQIEVHQEDKMPPLICELCVDKVNDFYEFLEMCRQTNKRTRLRLGLPPQTMPRGTSDAGDCILGVTEPVYLNEDSNESLLKPRSKSRNKGRFTKDSKNTNKTNSKENEVRSLRSKHTSPPPQRASKRTRDEDMSLSKLQLQKTRRSVTMPKSILRKENEIKVEEEWSPTRSKRSRDTRDTIPETVKRVKIVEKPTPKSDFKCKTCKAQFTSVKSLNNHMRIHNRPQPKYKSTPKPEKKNNCSKCKKDFPTKVSLDRHKCPKISGNKCGTCGRYISNLRNLANHERACQNKKDFIINPHLLKQLRPIQIRVKRCDPLLKKVGERYDVSEVDCNFGLDKNCIYPYLTSLRIKTEPSYMVNIHDTIDEFDLNQDYVHWDSDSLESDLEISDLREKGVGTLANLSLRTIFSHKFLGKVPKRKRRIKADKGYDSILSFDSNARIGIDNIIDGLDKDRSVNDTKDNDNDSLFGDNKTPISNDDFDSLFCSNNDSENSLNDNKSKPGDGKCEIVNKNNEIENKNSEKLEKINELNNDTLAELPCKDTIKNTQENEFSEVVPDNASISEVNNGVLMSNEQDLIIKDTEHKEDDVLISNKTIKDSEGKENEETILKNKDNIDKVEQNDKESSNYINNKETELTEKVIENDDSALGNKTEKITNKINDNDLESIPVNEKDISSDISPKELSGVNNAENNDSSPHDDDNKINDDASLNETLANNDNKSDKTAFHVNGDDKLDLDDLEDISDSEMDDNRLMDAIDEQIGEKKNESKSQENEKVSVSVDKSADLDSISSEELPNE